MYVTVTWFVGALLSMAFVVAFLTMRDHQYRSRTMYVGIAVCTAVIIFMLCYSKAYSLYFTRYIRAFEMRSILATMDATSLNDSRLILENERLNFFWKVYTFYVAELFDEPSKQLLLGVISISSYTDYCSEKQVGDKDFKALVRAIPDGFRMVAHKTVVISWLIVNEHYFRSTATVVDKLERARKRNSIYNGLLRYVDKNVVQDTSINYVVAECDDFLYWQQDVLVDNKFGFCGERNDLIWDFFYEITQEAFPNAKYFFIKVCNIDEAAFQRALQKQKTEKNQKPKTEETTQQQKLI